MKKVNITKAIVSIVTLVLLFSLSGVAAFADKVPPSVSASYNASTDVVTVTGTVSGVEKNLVVIEIIKPDKTLLYFGTAKIESASFASTIAVGALKSGTYTVRAADYDGGEYMVTTFVVESTGNSGGGSSLPSTETTPSSDPKKYYNDIPSSYSWAAIAINGLTDQGVVSGIGNKAFGPSNHIRRGDFVLMLVNAYHFSAANNVNFSDVPSGSYYEEAIAIAKALSLASGDGTSFFPQNSLSRQDAMVLLYRAMILKGITLPAGTSSDLLRYADAGEISDYAESAIATLIKAGIVTGDGVRLNPHATITRAEMAVMLYQALQIK